ncbi:hypothetical protein J7337_003195 [Fusarium musae]|uniref:Uncharacterized protein n=1 Tax=Fusarium musae TaxID=1042133 RepID=A0A9P8DQ02_9HYPO|nr:hypothetical protein J7337_003195 [Fusarium musae]KAG9506214.1 hypothetical protein J7337_003195 [Fusarium musae]
MLSSTPMTVLDPNVVIPSLSTRVRSSLTMPTQTLVARNWTQNNTTTKADDFPIFYPDRDGIIALALLAAILGLFMGLVLRDLLNKRRTGEFKEDKKSCGSFFRTLFRMPCIMCSSDSLRQLWIKFTNLFRSKKNQRVVKKADQDGIELDVRLQSGRPIGVFNGASSPKIAFASDKTRRSNSKGKAVETTVLPRVADFSVGQGFVSTHVRGASSGSNRGDSSEHDNTLGISNPEGLSTENAGSSATNNHSSGSSSAAASRSHWWSLGHGHGHDTSHSHSHSNSHSHDYGSHSYDFGHTDSGGFDSGGFDGGGGGGGGD